MSREDFLSWLTGERPAKPFTQFKGDLLPHPKSDISLVWKDPDHIGRTFPVISISAEGHKDFISFANTFIGNYNPLSAFFRVVPYSLFLELSSNKAVKTLDVPEQIVAVAIAEAIGRSRGRRKLAEVAIEGCLTTLSATMIRSFMLGYDRKYLKDIATARQSVFSIYGGAQNTGRSGSPDRVWDLLAQCLTAAEPASKDEVLESLAIEFVRSYLQNRVPNLAAWQRLVQFVPDLGSVIERMHGSREDRVRVHAAAMQSLLSYDLASQAVKEMIAGFITSLVAQGSLQYFELAQSSSEDLPGSIMWFAFFAGLTDGGDALTGSSNLGRRILRELRSPFSIFDPPVADINVAELELFSSGRPPIDKFRTTYSGVVSVELFPGVNLPYPAVRAELANDRERNRMVASEMHFLAQRLLELSSALSEGEKGSKSDQALDRPDRGRYATKRR